MFADKKKSGSTCPGWVRQCAGRSGRKSTGTGVTSAVAPGWASPESVGTSGTASTAPAPTTSTWNTALADQRTDATQPPGNRLNKDASWRKDHLLATSEKKSQSFKKFFIGQNAV